MPYNTTSDFQLLPLLSIRIKCFNGIASGKIFINKVCLDQTSRHRTGIGSERIPSVFSNGLCLLPEHEGLGMRGERGRVDTAHSSPPMWMQAPRTVLAWRSVISPCHTDEWMEKPHRWALPRLSRKPQGCQQPPAF